MKTLTAAKVKKEIERRNRIFKKASEAEKRVLIAKDVLDQLKSGRIKATRWYFFYLGDEENDQHDGKSLQRTFIENSIPACHCCGVGALMVSCTLFNNKQKIGDIELGGDLGIAIKNEVPIPNGLNAFFETDQLSLVEQAFECGDGEFGYDSGRAVYFGKQYLNSTVRLRAIMQNIIQNNGTFKP